MLVLTRKLGESVEIGPQIRVTLTRVGHGNARLAIHAPPEIKIRRSERSDPIPTRPDPNRSLTDEFVNAYLDSTTPTLICGTPIERLSRDELLASLHWAIRKIEHAKI